MLVNLCGPNMGNKGWKKIRTPKCIINYNCNIGDIDWRFYSVPLSFRKSVKLYKKLFFDLMDIVLLNANVFYDKQYGTKTQSLQFKMKVIEEIFENYRSFRVERQFIAKSSISLRLSERHFPSFNVSERWVKSGRYVVCSDYNKSAESILNYLVLWTM